MEVIIQVNETIMNFMIVSAVSLHDGLVSIARNLTMLQPLFGSFFGVILAFVVSQRESGFRDYKETLNYLLLFRNELEQGLEILKTNKEIMCKSDQKEKLDLSAISNYYYINGTVALKLFPIEKSNKLKHVYYKIDKYNNDVVSYRSFHYLTLVHFRSIQSNVVDDFINQYDQTLPNSHKELEEDILNIIDEDWMEYAEAKLKRAKEVPWWNLLERHEYEI